MTYETKAVQELEQKKAAELEVRNREVFDEILARYPLRDHTANFNLLVSWAGDGVLTIAKGEYLLKRKPEGLNPDVTTREALIDELGTFLRETTSEKTLSAHDFKMWKFRAGTWSLRQIRAFRKELELKRQLTTVEQARNYLTQAAEPKKPSIPATHVCYPRSCPLVKSSRRTPGPTCWN